MTEADLAKLAEFAGLKTKRFNFPYAEVKAGPLKEPMICYAHEDKFVCQIADWNPLTPAHGYLILQALVEKFKQNVITICIRSASGVSLHIRGKSSFGNNLWGAVCKAALTVEEKELMP